ncbi:major facilitator superfamily MFS_1 [Actinobacteria bacterium OK074]|nr:major facilitator superfamily MFS_1 [Actinobacteria bacterium OK074]
MPHQEAVSDGPDVPDVPDVAVVEDRWLLVAVAGVLSFVAMLDMNIVNVALADIASGLHVSATTAQWAVLGYQLPVVALLLPVGRRLDRTDPRTALLTATAGFALCGAAAALAPWAAWLIAARIAQGGCGAVLFVLMPVLALRSVRPERRGRAMSVPATLGPLGAVMGPAVGGLLLDHLGWRAVFLVKLPFCAAALVVAWWALPKGWGQRQGRGREQGQRPGPGRRGQAGVAEGVRPTSRPLADALLVAVAVTALLLALTLAPDGPWWLLLAVVAVPPAVWWLRGPGGRPVAQVLRGAGLLGAHGAVLAGAAGFAAMHYVVALHLQRDDGVSATTTGLTVLAFPLGMGLAGPVGGRLADRYRPRPVAVTGAALTAVGLALLVPLGDGWTPLDVAWRLALAGVGMGLTGGPTQALVMGAAPPDRAATVGATVQLARSLGFTLGPALATAAWGLAGPGTDTGVHAGLALAATAAWTAVPLLALSGRTGERVETVEAGKAVEPGRASTPLSEAPVDAAPTTPVTHP